MIRRGWNNLWFQPWGPDNLGAHTDARIQLVLVVTPVLGFLTMAPSLRRILDAGSAHPCTWNRYTIDPVRPVAPARFLRSLGLRFFEPAEGHFFIMFGIFAMSSHWLAANLSLGQVLAIGALALELLSPGLRFSVVAPRPPVPLLHAGGIRSNDEGYVSHVFSDLCVLDPLGSAAVTQTTFRPRKNSTPMFREI